MRVLILTHHYPPEVGAPQTRLSGTAAFLQSRGHDVRVLTALPSYPTGIIPPRYHGRLVLRETLHGIPVRRTWTYARPGAAARTRLLNQLSFTASALLAAPLVGRPEVILVESPPLFLGLTGAALGRSLGAPVVLHVSDLWPAVAIELGALRNRALIHAAESFELAVYRLSRRLIVVTEAWVARLVARGVPAAKISLVTNGVDAARFDPATLVDERRRLRSALGLDAQTVVACIGTVSAVYDYDLVLRVAQRLEARPEVRFLIVGDGSGKRALERGIARHGLTNLSLLPAQPREQIPALLAAADVVIVALQPIPFTRGQLPVRILEGMAMARPIVLAATLGEARGLVERAGAGLAVDPGDAAGLAAALLRLSADAALRRELGASGRQTILDRYSRATVAGQIEQVLRAAAAKGPSRG